MKIVFAAEIFSPDVGGPATYVNKLAQELVSQGHDVKVLTYSDSKSQSEDRKYNFKVFRVSRKTNVLFRYFKYLKQLKKLSRQADLIFAQGPIPSGLPAIIVKKLTGKKVIIKVVGDFSWERSRNVYGLTKNIDEFQNSKMPWKLKCLRWLQTKVLNQADLIITPSHYLKKIVSGWGINSDKVEVIYNAVEKIDCPLSPEAAKEDLKISGNIILSIGRLVPWKGFETLIKIFPKLLEVNNNYKLVIVGDGPERKNLEELIKQNNLSGQVVLTGQINHRDIPKFLRAADFFVLNTSYEGLPHLVVEALMMKLPVITTKIGGNPEVIENGVNGLLIDYNNEGQLLDAVKKIWTDKELVNKFVMNSEASLTKFSFSEMYQQTVAQFKNITEKN